MSDMGIYARTGSGYRCCPSRGGMKRYYRGLIFPGHPPHVGAVREGMERGRGGGGEGRDGGC